VKSVNYEALHYFVPSNPFFMHLRSNQIFSYEDILNPLFSLTVQEQVPYPIKNTLYKLKENTIKL
jgi:hypothetical protein